MTGPDATSDSRDKAEESAITTLYLDQHIRVIHKPHDISFHSDDERHGMVAQVKERYPADILFPIHRLDRVTSGLMVFARSQQSNRALSMMLENRQVEKYYLALSRRKPKKKQGSVIGDMQKGRGGSYLLKRQKSRPAITRFFSRPVNNCDPKLWLFLLKPETGKTHQLRVAMKSIGCPILGDRRYGGDPGDRAYLHAYRMRFDLFGKRYQLTDELFGGEFFDLQNERTVVDVFVYPELMPWSKKSCLLGSELPAGQGSSG